MRSSICVEYSRRKAVVVFCKELHSYPYPFPNMLSHSVPPRSRKHNTVSHHTPHALGVSHFTFPNACLLGLTVIAPARDGTMTFYWFGIRVDYLYPIPEKQYSFSSDRPTPWETWSLRTAGCFEIEHPLAAPILAGARWLMDSEPLVVPEFGLFQSKKVTTDRKTLTMVSLTMFCDVKCLEIFHFTITTAILRC